MKVTKKILKYTLIAFIGLLLAGVLIPFVFKDKLVAYLKENIHNNVNATVDFKDASFTLIQSFPDVRVHIDSLSVTGIDAFEGIILYQAEKSSIDIHLPSLFGGKTPEINSIKLTKPTVNLVVLQDSSANYLITKPDSTTKSSPLNLDIDRIEVTDGNLTYQDNMSQTFAVLEGITHLGKGAFSQDVFDLETQTAVAALSVKNQGVQYLSRAQANLDAVVHVDMPNRSFELTDNILRLNELDATGQGFVQLKGEDIITKLEIKTASEDIKSILSLLPNAYTNDFKAVKTQGKASASILVDGTYNGTKKILPAFDFKIKIADGYIKYPSLTQAISALNADVNISAQKPDYKDLKVNIPKFSMKIGSNDLSGRLLADNLTGNQKVDGKLVGKLDLKQLQQAFPLPDVELLHGVLDCDVSFNANMNDVNTENYEAIDFKGQAQMSDFSLKSKGKPKVEIQRLLANASPQLIKIQGDNMALGKSDLNLNAEIINPLAMLSTAKNIQVNVEASSNNFYVDEWQSSTTPSTQVGEKVALEVDENLVNNAKMNLRILAKNVQFKEHTITNLDINGSAAANALKVDNLSAQIKESDFKMNGIVLNAYDYVFNNGILDGKINMTSNSLDANQFMTTQSVSTSNDTPKVIPVPDNVRMVVDVLINNLQYTNLKLKNFAGQLEIQKNEVALRNLSTESLGGKIAMEGVYNTADATKPDFSIKLDLSKIKFAEAISKLEMFKKAAPIAAYIDGFFNTTLVMKGKLGSEMSPDLSSIDASGFLETVSGSLKGFNPVGQLADKLGVQELKEVVLSNTKNWFDIVQGYVSLKDFNKNIKGIDLTVSGKHGFGKDMDYNFSFIIPRVLMKKNKVTAVAESGLSLIENEASKLGINIDQGPNVYVDVKMTGSFQKPVFKITPKTGKGSSVKEAVTDKINESVSSLKDTINKEIKKKEQQLKDTIQKRANEAYDNLKQKAEEAARRAEDSIKNRVKDVVTQKLDTLTKGIISDSLKQKAKDAINNKGAEEVNKIKDKLKDFNPFKKKNKG